MKKMNESVETYACARRDKSHGYIRTMIVESTVSFDFSSMNTTTFETTTLKTAYFKNDEYDDYEVFANTCCLEDKEKIRIGDVSDEQALEVRFSRTPLLSCLNSGH